MPVYMVHACAHTSDKLTGMNAYMACTTLTSILLLPPLAATAAAHKVSGALSNVTLDGAAVTGEITDATLPADRLTNLGSITQLPGLTITSGQVSDFAPAVQSLIQSTPVPAANIRGRVSAQLISGDLPADVGVDASQLKNLDKLSSPLPAANIQGPLDNAYLSPDRVCTPGQQPANLGSCVRVSR